MKIISKKKAAILTAIVIGLVAISANALAQVHVRGHFRSNGTYVAPHTRSAPDGFKHNNYGNWR